MLESFVNRWNRKTRGPQPVPTRGRDAAQPNRSRCLAEPLEERILMAMAKAQGGSGYSANLAASGVQRQMGLIADPSEPAAGSTSTLYDASKVTLIGAIPGPGYDNTGFAGLIEVEARGQRRLQSLVAFLDSPGGTETGYVQIRYELKGTAGQLDHPRGWTVFDEQGTEGVDTHALRFELLKDVTLDQDIRFRVFAAPGGSRSGNPEDFLIVNDGTGKRLGPADLSPADASTKPTRGSIHGTAFEDVNGDGTYDAGDKPVGAATVFLDLDKDGKLGANEPRQLTASDDGTYFFDGIAPGTYDVREVTPGGFLGELTAPAKGVHTVQVAAGRRVRGVDFGNLKPGAASGVVFNDLDGDGIRDRNELGGVSGATVYVDLNRNGRLDRSEPSAVSSGIFGGWSIGGLSPGTYVVRQIPPAGYVQTAPSSFHVITISGSGMIANTSFGDHAVGPRVTGVYVSASSWSADFKNSLAAAGLGDGTVGFLIDPREQFRALPWATIDQVSIRFDSPLEVSAGDLAVLGMNVRAYALRSFSYDPNTYTATWTLTQNLVNDRLTLNLDADAGGVSGNSGKALDGEWAGGNDTYPSGDGAPGGDFVFGFNVLGGDSTGDGFVNALDLSYAKQRLNRTAAAPGAGNAVYTPSGDVNPDTRINALDLSAIKQRLNRRLPRVIILPPILPIEPPIIRRDPPILLETPTITREVFSEATIL